MNEQYNNNAKMDDDLLDVLLILKELLKYWWLMLLVGTLCAGAIYTATKVLVHPTYQSSFCAYVNNRNQSNLNENSMSISDISASRYLASTYAEIIVSRPVIEMAVEKVGGDYSYQAVKNGISVTNLNDTEIISVNVTSDDPEKAYAIASAMEEVCPKRIEEIIVGSSMTIVSPAVYSPDKHGVNSLSNAIKGFLLGVALVMIVVRLRLMLDDHIKNEKDVENRFGLVMMGVIHDMDQVSQKGYYGYYGYYGHRSQEEKK